MHFEASKPHFLAGVISNVVFTLKKGSSVRPHLVTNGYGKTVDQEKRAIGILFCRQVSNDEMPEKNGYGMKAPVQATLTDMRDVAVLSEEQPGRLKVTSEITRSCESDCDNLRENQVTLRVIFPRNGFKEIIDMTENGCDCCLHFVPPDLVFFVVKKNFNVWEDIL
jgi:hypothetical protein